NGDGTFGYDPSTITGIELAAAGSSFVDTFTYTATDGQGRESKRVNATDRATASADTGTASNVDGGTVAEDSSISSISVVTSVSADTYDVIASHAAATPFPYTTLFRSNGDGTFGYDPSTITGIELAAAGSSFVDTFTYTATDG